MTDNLKAYQQRMNAERLARQAPDVQGATKDILRQLRDIEQYLYWSMDPIEKDGGAYYCQCLLDHAHELVDQAHAYRLALQAFPSSVQELETALDRDRD